jgi:hypothetical protein
MYITMGIFFFQSLTMDDPLQMHPIRRRNLPNFAGPVAAASGKLSRPSAARHGGFWQYPTSS